MNIHYRYGHWQRRSSSSHNIGGFYLVKRIIAIALSTLLLFTLSSCGAKYRSINAIKQSGNLIVSTNAEFPPYEFYEGNEITGFDMEIMTEVAKELGVSLKITDVAFESVLTSVKTGSADVAASGLSITEERKKSVDFSDSYVQATQVIIVAPDSKVQSADDIVDGVTVGVQIATTGDIYVTGMKEDEESPVDITINRYNKGADAVMDLKNGKVDCVVIDNMPAKKFVEQNPNLTILADPFEDEFYAFAVDKGNKALLDTINKVVRDMRADGRYDAIFEKYIGE